MAKAGEQGKAILELQDDHPAGLYLKGEGLLQEGMAGAAPPKVDAARKLFVQASDADPEPQYLDARGRAAEEHAKLTGNSAFQEDAIRSYAKAVEKDPSFFASWVGQGRLYVLRKQHENALAPLEKAFALKQTAEAAGLLGIAAFRVGNPKAAVPWLEKSLGLGATADVAYTLGQVYATEAVNNDSGAINAYDRAVRLANDEEKKTGLQVDWLTEALYQLGDLNFTKQRFREAKSAWEKYLERKPVNAKQRVTAVTTHLTTTLKGE
jgi:tetratricopeptide (TPR) repeat protein